MSSHKQLLERAFKDFSKASEVLVNYYKLLENQIRELKNQIEEKNRELEQSRENLQFILDSLPLGVAVLEGERLLFSNKHLNRLANVDLLRKITYEKDKSGEFKNGRYFYRWRKESLGNGFKGKEVIVFEDITEIEKVKERNEIEKKLLAMGEMATRIAHEIRNPLGSMELFLSMMIKGKKNKKYIEYVLFGIKTIERIISNILSYTKPKKIVLVEENLSNLIRETLDFMSISLKEKDINVEFNAFYNGTFLFDPDLMRLVLMNLISNAKEAIREKGKIRIELKEEGKFVVLSVSDNGVGMDDDIKKDIFNPFFSTRDKGVGLGLFIVYNIVKAHGGYVDVESKKNEGSTFFVYLPKESK